LRANPEQSPWRRPSFELAFVHLRAILAASFALVCCGFAA
jgi:hypothetical protein